MRKYFWGAIASALLFFIASSAQENKELEHFVNCALITYDLAYEKINDLAFDATAFEKSLDGDGNIKETKKYVKKIYLKKTDTGKFKYREEYLEYYVDGEKKEKEDLKKLAKDKEERKKRRGGRDISFNITTPLKPENKESYQIKYDGIVTEPSSGLDCHLISARPILEKFEGDVGDTLVNYLFYIDTSSFHIARVDFEPATMVSKFMFKMKELKMSIRCEPYDDEIWLPSRFSIKGQGKAMYFMGINFEGEELYSDPVVNGGLDDAVFE